MAAVQAGGQGAQAAGGDQAEGVLCWEVGRQGSSLGSSRTSTCDLSYSVRRQSLHYLKAGPRIPLTEGTSLM